MDWNKIDLSTLIDLVKKDDKEAETILIEISRIHLIKFINKYINLAISDNKIFGILLEKNCEANIRQNMEYIIQGIIAITIVKFKKPQYNCFGFYAYLDKVAINAIRKYIIDYTKHSENIIPIEIGKDHDDVQDINDSILESELNDKKYHESSAFGIELVVLNYFYKELENYKDTTKIIILERDREEKSFNEISDLLKLKGVELTERQVISRYNHASKKIYAKFRKKLNGEKK